VRFAPPGVAALSTMMESAATPGGAKRTSGRSQ